MISLYLDAENNELKGADAAVASASFELQKAQDDWESWAM
jgi:hypothetical protein